MGKFIEHTITQSEINSSYLCISKNIDFFPADTIGGANKNFPAKSSLSIHYGSGEPVITDIAGDKMIFRKRGWISEFIGIYKIKAGDKVVIERLEQYTYKIYSTV